MTLGIASVLLVAMTVGNASAQDLIVSWKKVRQGCVTGQNTCGMKGKLVVSNIDASVGTAASSVAIFLSDDAVFNPAPEGNDTLLTIITPVEALAPEGMTSIKPIFQLPIRTSASGRFLFAVADFENAVGETNETNNVAVFANPGPAGVILFDKLFDLDNITIPVGARVRWMHKDPGQQHTVTSGTCDNNDNCIDTGLFTSGHDPNFLQEHQEFIHVFNAAGSFPYFCEKHESDMTGTINVVNP